MALTHEEQLKHLISQIQLPDEIVSFFEAGQLTRVDVSARQRQWIFYVQLLKPLPANVYMQFQQYLKTAFTNIADVSIMISTQSQAIDQEMMAQYWHLALDHSQLNHAKAQQLASNTILKLVNDNEFSVAVGAQLLFQSLDNQAVASIVSVYESFGFPSSINPMLLTGQIEGAIMIGLGAALFE